MRPLVVIALVGACDAGLPPPSPSQPQPPPPHKDWSAKVVRDEDVVRKPTAADLAVYTRDIQGAGNLVATIETSLGTLHCTLYADKTPMTVANFVGLATGKKAWTNPTTGQVEHGKPFYDGLIFHRVIPQFMIQGGDPLGKGVGGPGYSFADEIADGLAMNPGTLAMANAGPGPNREGTNGSQFFIMETGDRPDLVGRHTIFGGCKELDVVKAIARVPRNSMDKPDNDVRIVRISFTKE
jgi:peptidyl-prolyl cis-trans isomerase A (cyclophilin A)